MKASPGNIPVKTAAQRERLRAKRAVRRHGMDYRPKTAKGKGERNG